MNEFKERYPSRVTLCEDGVYRWSYDVDLSRDHTLHNLVMKIMLIICGSICAIMVVMMLCVQDFTFFWIPLVCCGVAMLIALVVLRLFRLGLHDCYTLGYEMNEESILLVQTPAVQRSMNTMAGIAGGIGAVTGKSVRVPAMNAAAQSGPTRFSRIRTLREHRDTHMLNLATSITSLQVWVCPEDYDMVRNFIQSRAASSPRYGRSLRWPKRLGLSAILALVADIVIGVVNYIGFQNNGRLPISFTTVRNEVAHQNGIVMSTMFIVEGSSREEPWWMNQLESQPGTALLSLLVLTLVFFLILTVIHQIRKDTRIPEETDSGSNGQPR